MAHITLAGVLLDPTGEFAVGDKVRFIHQSSTGETIQSAVSVLTVPPNGAYSINLEYGLVMVQYNDYRRGQYLNLGIATVNATNTATSIPELLNALVPVSDPKLVEFQAILADAVTAKVAAENAATTAEAFAYQLTTTELIASTATFTAATVIPTSGFTTSGTGGAPWKQNGVTGQTVSQTPAQLGGALLNDGNGNQWALVQGLIVTLESLGFSSATDESLVVQAAANATNDGGTISTLKKHAFGFGGVTVSNKTLRFDFKNSNITMLTPASLIQASGSYRSQQTVSSITGSTVSVLTIASSTGYAEGDIVKIVSTDEQPDFWVAGRYLGQFAVIDSIAGNNLTLDRLITDASLYINNVNIAILNRHTVDILNANINVAEPTDNLAVILIRDMVSPTTSNITINDSKDACILFKSCFGYLSDNDTIINALDNSGSSNFGYAIEDSSCDNGRVKNLLSTGSRHAFTTNSHTSSGGVDMSCGYTTRAEVNGKAYGATSGAWDTHPGAIGVTFLNCKAFSSQAFGQSRSRFTQFINGYGRSNTSGIKFSTGKNGSTINPIKSNLIDSCDLQYDETFCEHYLQSGAAIGLTDVSEVTIKNSEGISKNAAYRGMLIESRNTPIKLTIDNYTIDAQAGFDTDALMLLAPVALNDINVNKITLKSETTTTTSGTASLVKFTSSVTSLAHRVIVQDATFEGLAWQDKSVRVVDGADALIYNARVEKITTGSLTAVVVGSLLTWGATV
jgi:hypothetical protein